MTHLEFELPDPGEGITEAEIVEWYVEEGQQVREDDPLADIETDKAIVEIPVPATGTVVELVAEEGDMVAVGDVVAVFETDEPFDQQRTEGRAEEIEAEPASTAELGTDIPEEETATAEPEVDEAGAKSPEPEEATREPREARGEAEEEPATAAGRIFAAPSTRRYAREQGVDLSEVKGSGPNGRILRSDVDTYLAGAARPQLKPTETAEPALHPESSEASEQELLDVDEERSTRRPLRGLRKRIAENMVRSARTVPHVTSGFEANATELVALKERLDGKYDVRVTYTPILVKAVISALKAFPIVNASVDDAADEIIEKHYYDIGFATHTDEGLLVPVVRDVDQKSLVEVAKEMGNLAEQARDRSIDVTDLQGGTFTVTNLGTHGEHRTFGTPIINYPQAAIMGVGRIREEPVATDDGVEVHPRIGLTLSYDHRIIDGVTANEFMESVIESIEDTDVLLSRL